MPSSAPDSPRRRIFSVPARALRLARPLAWLLGAAYFAFVLLVLVLRYAVMPHVADYRGDLERALSATLHLPVAVAAVEGDWQGLRPKLVLHKLQIRDSAGRPALSFDHVEAVLAWSTLFHLEPRLHLLGVDAPVLDIRRDAAGRLFVAGLAVDTGDTRPGFADWLLRQNHLAVSDATVTWTDEMRAAPPLTLSHVNLVVDNGGSRHRFGLTAEPPGHLAEKLDLRGDLHGRDLAAPDRWRGELYVDLPRTDLAVWRTWIDYPVELPRGHGALRLWLDFAALRPTAVTADVALDGVSVRLAPELPMLELGNLSGRLQFAHEGDAWQVATRRLALATADGVAIAPADVSLRWHSHGGEFSATRLDLGDLLRLSAHLPLAEPVRRELDRYAPRGRLRNCTFTWGGDAQHPFRRYRIEGSFDGLTLSPGGAIPGVAGLSGSIAGDQAGGRVDIASRDAALDLPTVFPESRIALASLDANLEWTRSGEDFSIELTRASFRNADAEGRASGHYRRRRAGTPGEIDLDAKLTRGEGNAVWRYLPHAVNADTRNWLRDGVTEGRADDVTLKLKGDLAHFPFTDRSGVFRIQGRFRGATLKPAPGWPAIEDITGDLLFDAARMRIGASQGQILGATVGPVVAEIADLEAPEELLTVEGKARGPTAAFLRFIEASPVGERIDHFTEDMRGIGNGELELKLSMPLRHVVDTRVTGGYRFDGNKLAVAPGVPALDDVRGRIEFSEKALGAKDIRARALGGAMSLDIRTQNEGQVAVDARGEISIAQLRQQMPSPLFDHLSGSSRWEGTVRVKKKNPEIRIASDLRGIASSLPEPFNKTAAESRALVVERKTPDPRLFPKATRAALRDELDVSLARALQFQWIRMADETGAMHTERALAAVGANPPRLPERGALLAVNMPRLDADLLRRFAGGAGRDASTPALPSFTQIDIRADEAVAFGRSLHELRLAGSSRNERWTAELKSREMTGRFDWSGEGKGRLAGRIAQLVLPASTAPAATAGGSALGDEVDELPALDLTFDRFVFGERDFGSVRIVAENTGSLWHATIDVQNADVTLNADGRWRRGTDAPETQVDFKLKAGSIENTLKRIGYPNAVRRGSATLEGKLTWDAAPVSPDIPTLAGSIRFEARDGQFAKLEPGVGRLLGVISLQSLPRRITLDFRDVFSEGFAFDRIEGEATLARGVADTRDLEIRGPAARVAMQGSFDLNQETQNLRVRVQPALGESVATGALLAHPAVGATAWVFNKLFGNPLDKIFAYEYAVSGSWADPKVEKVGGPGRKDAAAEARTP